MLRIKAFICEEIRVQLVIKLFVLVTMTHFAVLQGLGMHDYLIA